MNDLVVEDSAYLFAWPLDAPDAESDADVLEEVKAKGRVVVLGGAEAVAGAGLEAVKLL